MYRSYLGAAVFFVLCLLATAGLRSYRDLSKARSEALDLEQQIVETQGRVDLLTSRIERVEEDPLTLERLAREDLGMVRPGDMVIVLPDEPPETP